MWTTPYLGSPCPGAPGLGPIEDGANCQRYAYAVLELFGIRLPPLRSDELWADTAHTTRVTSPMPLDVLLFNPTADPYSTHVGLWMSEGQVLHLRRAAGRPQVWSPE